MEGEHALGGIGGDDRGEVVMEEEGDEAGAGAVVHRGHRTREGHLFADGVGDGAGKLDAARLIIPGLGYCIEVTLGGRHWAALLEKT